MKKLYFLLILALLPVIQMSAQAPQQFRYQARISDANGAPLANQEANVEINIRKDNAQTGQVVFTENHTVQTSSDGLISLTVGSVNDLSVIDWSSGSYYMQVSVNGSVQGSNQILSIPYALYASTTDSVKYIEYSSIKNAPDFAGWDTNAADDFNGDYNSLTNKPVTITPEQSDKIDSILLTASVNLDSIVAKVGVNNTKVSFPGFGTVPGTALEGNNVIWEKADTNIFYTHGNVGIGVPVSSDFGGSVLHVGGGIWYDGIPSAGAPGLLFYDTTGTGTFSYYDDQGIINNLSSGTLTYTGAATGSDLGDITVNNDLIVQGSLGVGTDAVNGENFGFNTMILKENNLRILFDDSDDPNGTYPSNDWQIEINNNLNGGPSYFAINDITHSTTPFKIMAGAPDNAFFISSEGKVGIGTNTPAATLEVAGTLRAEAFIGDGSGLTGITGATGGISNNDTTLIAADTNSDFTGIIEFQTMKSPRMVIANDGKVGIGTTSPQYDLDVAGDAQVNNLNVENSAAFTTLSYKATPLTFTGAASLDLNVEHKSLVTISADAIQTIEGFSGGVAGQTITLVNLSANSIVIVNGGTGTQAVKLPAASLTLGIYMSASFVCDGNAWYCTGLNN